MTQARGRHALAELQSLIGEFRDDLSFRIGTETQRVHLAWLRGRLVTGALLAALLGLGLLVAGGLLLMAIGTAQWLSAPGGPLSPGVALVVVGAVFVVPPACVGAWLALRARAHTLAVLHRRRHLRFDQQRVDAGRDSVARATLRAAALGRDLPDPEAARDAEDVLHRQRELANLALGQTLSEMGAAARGAADAGAWVRDLPLSSGLAAAVAGVLVGSRLGGMSARRAPATGTEARGTPATGTEARGAAGAGSGARGAAGAGSADGRGHSRRDGDGVAGALLAALLPLVEHVLIEALRSRSRQEPAGATPREADEGP